LQRRLYLERNFSNSICSSLLAFSPSSLLERSRNTIPMVCVGLTAGARADIADVNIAEIDAPAVFAVQIRAAGQVRFGHHG
jgi:hypothetical protein